jgi:hypothetical protein
VADVVETFKHSALTVPSAALFGAAGGPIHTHFSQAHHKQQTDTPHDLKEPYKDDEECPLSFFHQLPPIHVMSLKKPSTQPKKKALKKRNDRMAARSSIASLREAGPRSISALTHAPPAHLRRVKLLVGT